MTTSPLSALAETLLTTPLGLLALAACAAYAVAMSATGPVTTPASWHHEDAIPGLSAAERAEYLHLASADAPLSPVQQARMVALDAQVDSDLAALGLARDDIPLLVRG